METRRFAAGCAVAVLVLGALGSPALADTHPPSGGAPHPRFHEEAPAAPAAPAAPPPGDTYTPPSGPISIPPSGPTYVPPPGDTYTPPSGPTAGPASVTSPGPAYTPPPSGTSTTPGSATFNPVYFDPSVVRPDVPHFSMSVWPPTWGGQGVAVLLGFVGAA